MEKERMRIIGILDDSFLIPRSQTVFDVGD